MASRLYSSTRQLYRQVERMLCRLQVTTLGTPTLGVLMALYVTGLILLDGRPTQTRVARFLPGRCHDALNRLLGVMPWSTRALMGLLVAFVKRLPVPGYLCLDDVIIEKPFAKRLPWAGWTYSYAKKRHVYGLHVVILLWCREDGRWRIPVAFRLWRPKRSCAPRCYRTKVQLAQAMVTEVLTAQLPVSYIVFDKLYTAGWFTRWLNRVGLKWYGVLDPKTKVRWRSRVLQVAYLEALLKLKWRAHLGLRATALRVYAPKYGHVRLVVTRNRHGNLEYLVTNDLQADLTTVVQRKRSRWSIETLFRDTKQFASLAACQCWVDQAMVRHVALVLLTFVVLQMLRSSPYESVGAVKEHWQLAVLRNGEHPPEPLRACPTNLRVTA